MRVYMYIDDIYTYTYIYTRDWPDWPIICSSGQPTRRRLPFPGNIAFSLLGLLRAYARVRKCSINGIWRKTRFIGACALLRSLLHPRSAHILVPRAYSCYVSSDLQLKSRSHILKRGTYTFFEEFVHGHNFIRQDKSNTELCKILFRNSSIYSFPSSLYVCIFYKKTKSRIIREITWCDL